LIKTDHGTPWFFCYQKWLPMEQNKKFSPHVILIRGFLIVIFTGTILLSLPFAVHQGRLPFLDALFTATSAVCVTGLVVVDTGTAFTPLGQTVIMLLIMVGSLGFMTMATLIFVILGRQITLRDRLLIHESFNTHTIQGMVLLILSVIRLAFLLQFIGTILLSIRFVPLFGWGKGLFYALFHAVSAFGNAGFDLMGGFDSLTSFVTDPLVMGTIALLFIIGGLGFTVVIECYQKRRYPTFSLHTKVVLGITVFLLVFGTLSILLMEFSNDATLGTLPFFNKILAAFFTAATPRTAGFNVVPTNLLHPYTLFFLLTLMFIGASPASTGGGIKTTTFVTLALTVINTVRGNQDVVIGRRRLPHDLVMRSLAVTCIAFSLIVLATLVLTMTENKEFMAVLFEVVSAFGTVGLSAGLTPGLTPFGRIIIIFIMFTGRVGPLTIAFALAKKKSETGIRYPEERIMVG
jgi:trk system potassium uptake protein